MAEANPVSPSLRPALSPVSSGERIASIDVVRGVALLGILLVNINYMAMPAGIFFEGSPPADASWLSTGAWYFYRTFCEGKFYPLFSMLFGAGLAIQFERARARGSRWWAAPLRRIFTLGFIGLAHAILIWFGDILFAYALVGFVMIFLVRLSTKGLFVAAGVLLLISLAGVALSAALTALGGHFTDQKPASEMVLDARPPLIQLFDGLESRKIHGPWSAEWKELESRALRDGPFTQATGFRAINWLMMLIFMLLGGGSVILMLFVIGALLIRRGFFNPENAPVQRRVALFGWSIGLPCALISAVTFPHQAMPWATAVLGITHSLGGPVLSLGYLGTIVLWANRSGPGASALLFASAGRMALTSYLLCSILGTAIFYHWGLGWFGQFSVIQRLGLALIVYAAVATFAVFWLRSFAFGPAEWFWRMMTYLRVPPLLKSDPSSASNLPA